MTQLSRWFRRDRGNLPVRRDQQQPTPGVNANYPLATVRDELDRVFDFFDDFMGNFPDYPVASQPGTRRLGRLAFGGYSPALDIAERDDALEISLELPGLDEQDIDVSVSDNQLTVRGEKKQDYTDEGVGWTRSERSYGQFQRVLALPAGVDADNVRASFDRGVLRITLPKTEPAKSRRIPVEATSARIEQKGTTPQQAQTPVQATAEQPAEPVRERVKVSS